jgi:hypothetical protein
MARAYLDVYANLLGQATAAAAFLTSHAEVPTYAVSAQAAPMSSAGLHRPEL